MTRSEWLREQDRRRLAVSWLSSALFYVLAALLFLLFGILRIDEVSEYSGPVMIRLGQREGVEAEPRPLESPDSTERAPDPETLPPEPPEPLPASVEAASVPPRPATAPAPSPSPGPAVPKPAPAPTAPATPAPAAPALPRTPPAPPVIKGSEVGNSYETTFEASSGTISRSLYEPVWLYMPPPKAVDDGVYVFMKPSRDGFYTVEDRKRIFEQWYARPAASGGKWVLKGEVPLTERPKLWLLMQESGLRQDEMDYRFRSGLKPVELSFRLTSADAGAPRLEEVRLVSSSGYPDIDEAVLYGFRQASFSNAADRSVTGRFVYRFEGSR